MATNQAVVHPSHTAALSQTPLLQVLRDELFTLESERLTGKISEAQYNKMKPALETVLQSALERQERAAQQQKKTVAA